MTVYYRVDAGGRLLIGGRGPMREYQRPAEPHLCAYARQLWPILKGAMASCLGRTACDDRRPLSARPRARRGVLVCLGYNGRGVAMATAMGDQFAQPDTSPAEPSTCR